MVFYVVGSSFAQRRRGAERLINIAVIYLPMKKGITFLNKQSIIALATLITIGIFIFKFPEQKRPFFTAKSSILDISKINRNFSSKKLELKHLYNCQSKSDLNSCQKRNLTKITTTRIMLWNGGRKTIDKTDIADNPL